MNKFIKPSIGNCLLIVFITTFLFLGNSYFNTKGEPREALVPQAMIRSGNWILPERYGDVVATKPPMTHWLMSFFSLVNNNTVTETTSRLPSACAAFCIVAALFLFIKKYRSEQTAFLACLLLVSTIDFHRSAMTARVDMTLSCFMFIGMLLLFKWHREGMKGMPFSASFMLSCAALTKGPVGIILPCFVFFTYTLLEKTAFTRIVIALFKIALPATLLPILWYVAAYIQGGDDFLNVVMEENIGRFTGKMSYESHNNPFFFPYLYSFIGCMPWSLSLLLAFPFIKWKGFEWKTIGQKIIRLAPIDKFSLTAAACILLFYTIPSSKRAVYQLPAYPFFAYFIARFYLWMHKEKPQIEKIFGIILCVIAALALIGLSVLPLLPPNDDLVISALQHLPINFLALCALALVLGTLIFLLMALRKNSRRIMAGSIMLFFAIQFALDATLLPAIKNKQSIKTFVTAVNTQFPHRPHFGYQAQFWQLNYYLDTKLTEFDPSLCEGECTLFICANDIDAFKAAYPMYTVKEIMRTPHKKTDVRDYICLMLISKQP